MLPLVRPVALTPKELRAAFAQCQSRGVRGAAMYDFLHLCAARKVGADALVTLDLRHFQAIVRAGDPRVEAPRDLSLLASRQQSPTCADSRKVRGAPDTRWPHRAVPPFQ